MARRANLIGRRYCWRHIITCKNGGYRTTFTMTTSTASRKTALIMGVANKRSIAWACVQSFLEKDFDVIFTYQNERFQQSSQTLISSMSACNSTCTLQALPCQVQTEIPLLFQERLPKLLGNSTKLHAIVHSIAFAPDLKNSTLLTTSRDTFQVAHDVSTFSFLETARESLPLMHSESSLTALSYIGAVRAVPHYNVMGPAKASLESVVRGLALELGTHHHVRVNAVSAGPLLTLAARGITGISDIRNDVEQRAPLQRNVTAKEVADTISFLATEGTGITGQTIYVDGGYSIVV